jgi:hypothetical protein
MLKAIGTSDVYEWMLGDVVLEAQTSEIQATESGLYTVRSISADGCRSEGFASLSFTVTGTETGAEDAVMIYPNPASGIVYAKVNSSMRGLAEVSLFNAAGKPLWSHAVNFTDEATPIHLEELPAGLYHLLVRKGERVMVKKIVLR